MMSQHDRRARRKRMAEAVGSGETPESVAVRESVSPNTVRAACAEFRVLFPTVPRKSAKRTLDILAALFDPARTFRQIAADFGVIPQWVEQVNRRARDAGIPVPDRPAGRRRVAAEERRA